MYTTRVVEEHHHFRLFAEKKTFNRAAEEVLPLPVMEFPLYRTPGVVSLFFRVQQPVYTVYIAVEAATVFTRYSAVIKDTCVSTTTPSSSSSSSAVLYTLNRSQPPTRYEYIRL